MAKKIFRRYHQNGSLPDESECFVFGSNLAGRHGKGAAEIAMLFGARRGIGQGRCGMTYAIPTKSRRIITLAIETIKENIEQFIKYTKDNPELSFFVTAIGCGYAGFHHSQIAPFFKEAINCSFPFEWKPYLEDDHGTDQTTQASDSRASRLVERERHSHPYPHHP